MNAINAILAVSCVLLVCADISAGIHSPPTMVKQPPHQQLYQVSQSSDEAHRPFMLECEANGDPEPTYRWIKNGLEFNYKAYDKRINGQPRRGTLVFISPDAVDEGLYQCFAENRHGVSVSNAVFLRRSELNSFPDEDIKEIYATEGEPLIIDCNPPTGYPKPSIFWIMLSNTGALRDVNSSRLTVDPEGRLHFSYVKREDMLHDAMYACSATSVFRTEYKVGRRIVIVVKPSTTSGETIREPTVQYISPSNVIALRGQQLELHCIFGGTPLQDIVWHKTGGILERSHYSYGNYGKTLIINKVEYNDEDLYICVAGYEFYTQIYHVSVTVESAPYWIQSPVNTNLSQAESVSFECSANGIPEPSLQWFVNGIPIDRAPANQRRKIEGNVMTIEDVLETVDTAVYQCNASNIHGYVFKNFYLNVLNIPPEITEAPKKITSALLCKTVTLRCRAFGAPKPIVIWFRDNLELFGGRYKRLENGDLQIISVIMTDAGEYTCIASNVFGNAKAMGELRVRSETVATVAPESIEVVARQTVVFRCAAEADASLNLTVEWLFNNNSINFERDPRLLRTADNSLTIAETNELDSGIYC